jgi:hypothetical protein
MKYGIYCGKDLFCSEFLKAPIFRLVLPTVQDILDNNITFDLKAKMSVPHCYASQNFTTAVSYRRLKAPWGSIHCILVLESKDPTLYSPQYSRKLTSGPYVEPDEFISYLRNLFL